MNSQNFNSAEIGTGWDRLKCKNWQDYLLLWLPAVRKIPPSLQSTQYRISTTNRRKFRSQTSDNMDRWKAEMGRVREKRRVEERRWQKRKSQKKEAQMREKVGKSRNTVFFQWFVAPEGRKVGSLKRGFGPLLEVQMSFCVAGARDCAPCQSKREGFVSFSISTTTTPHYTPIRCNYNYTFTTFHYTTPHYTTLHSIELNYTHLHPIARHYTTLHSTTLRSTTLHYTTLHYTTLHYTTLHYIPLHYTTLTTTILLFTTLHCTTLITPHYTKLHSTTLHYTYNYNYNCNCNCNYTNDITLH